MSSENQDNKNIEQYSRLGGYVLSKEPITFNDDKPAVNIKVRNTGDRAIQVGSHFHFFEVNRVLEFNRDKAFGKRLNITSTTAIRFEPGDEVEVSLIPFGGKKTLYGFNNLVDGWTGENIISHNERPNKIIAIHRARERGYKFQK